MTLKGRLPLFSLTLIGIFPFFINGWIVPNFNNNLTFWIFDTFIWIFLPLFLYLYCLKKKYISNQDLGLSLPLKRKSDQIKFTLMMIVFPIIFYFVYHYSYYTLAKGIFPTNYLKNEMSYGKFIPNTGPLKFLVVIYFSCTAGFVEEIFYRGFLLKVFDKNKLTIMIYFILSPVIFSVVHWEGGVWNLFATFNIGMVCCLTFYFYRSLWPLIIGHFITDFIIFS